jgi:uracil-DNA glycosylase
MALHESALEELGLAPLWVRRGSGHSVALDAEQRSVAELRGVEGAGREPFESESLEMESVKAEGVKSGKVKAESVDVEGIRAEGAKAESARAEGARAESVRAENATAENATAESVRAETTKPESVKAGSADRTIDATADEPDDYAWFDELPAQLATEVKPEPRDAVEPSVDTLDWDALSERVAACRRCRLCEKRTNTVFGVGDREADWMLIGEAPGENEDRQGEPFVGQAGKLLDNMLRSLSLERGTNVYIANVIKCRPPGNRNPEPDEVARCEPYLQRQVALVKPKLIVALGRFAAQSLLKTEASISSLRGRVHSYEGVPVVVTYHPAYLLRSLADKSKAWADLCLARDTWRKAAGAAEHE